MLCELMQASGELGEEADEESEDLVDLTGVYGLNFATLRCIDISVYSNFDE